MGFICKLDLALRLIYVACQPDCKKTVLGLHYVMLTLNPVNTIGMLGWPVSIVEEKSMNQIENQYPL